MRAAEIYMDNIMAGMLIENDEGYQFTYEPSFLEHKDTIAISLTMPKRTESYTSKIFFPFFDGLIPEGWLLQIAEKNWKLNQRDRMGLLMACCKDCIGAVSVHQIIKKEADE
jgi:serine/threonine-protein kinase HipA